MPKQELTKKITHTLSNSRFFTVSLLIHLMVVVGLGGAVLFKNALEENEFWGDPGGMFAPAGESAPTASVPQAQPLQNLPATPAVVAPSAPTPVSSMNALTSVSPNMSNFVLPSFAGTSPNITPTDIANIPTPRAPTGAPGAMPMDVARNIQAMTGSWAQGGTGGGTSGQGLRQRRFEFTAFLAKYSGGDWNSTVEVRNDRVVKGSLPNLLYVMKQWSNERIDAKADAVPLDLASDAIFEAKPPFIFFTGRRDFVLTDQEVQNLRKYIMSGGAIWGDSSLPGRRSRFDIAFRREMRRVLPDRDKDFEVLEANHPIFSGGYYPEIRQAPSGINYYQEPVEVLRFYDEIAVIYTANSYGDMWQIGLMADGTVDMRRDENRNLVAINHSMWERRNIYFRNMEPETLAATYKFGTNVVVHLLTRWENRLRNVPQL
ncbi:MAG: DUF4159 domain-containing protein [Verrucomicrobiales bacterium]